ncbi:hypothetical protein T459_01549 [Capsicum annuum]|uniref:Non-structural maintenance of chromosomes element 4 n=1 Tax=Capsicum annuum TaxID=4072 RepID=A0A2G3AHF8_CAPAN|nr:hypothetical protein T459_01549 [Capsicum annuum]
MKKLNLGPNGGILTSLDLFTTKFDEMRDLGDARIITRIVKGVTIENLVLNRKCFMQTIENLFVLAFLVKDGRVVIYVDENGSHFLCYGLDLWNQPFIEIQGKAAYTRPLWNGPAACLVISGEVKYNQFVFGLDFTDWENMSRNHGKVLREGSNIDNYPEIGDANIRNGNLKRKLL